MRTLALRTLSIALRGLGAALFAAGLVFGWPIFGQPATAMWWLTDIAAAIGGAFGYAGAIACLLPGLGLWMLGMIVGAKALPDKAPSRPA